MCADRDISLVCPDLGVSPLKIKLYPNPATETLGINIENNSSEVNTVSIYNLYGIKFSENNLNNSSLNFSQEINISSLMSGIYYLQIKNLDGEKITKFFVKD
jgi:hypothetical protein